MNKQTLAVLLTKGVALGDVMVINHAFFSFSMEGVAELRHRLTEDGFEDVTRGTRKGTVERPYWLVEGRRTTRMLLDELGRVTDECVAAAVSTDAEYDGWYVEVPRRAGTEMG